MEHLQKKGTILSELYFRIALDSLLREKNTIMLKIKKFPKPF